MPTEAEKLLDSVSCFITPSAIWRNFIELITPSRSKYKKDSGKDRH